MLTSISNIIFQILLFDKIVLWGRTTKAKFYIKTFITLDQQNTGQKIDVYMQSKIFHEITNVCRLRIRSQISNEPCQSSELVVIAWKIRDEINVLAAKSLIYLWIFKNKYFQILFFFALHSNFLNAYCEYPRILLQFNQLSFLF